MKIIIKNIINENIDPEEKYVNGLSNIINIPYFYNLKVTDTPEHLWNRILSKKFNKEVTVDGNYIYDSNNNIIYSENSNGYWWKRELDSNNNEIYYENSDGDWDRYEYDSKNNQIYRENSRGYWEKQEYDSNNNRIYYENSDGKIMDNRSNNPINENIDPEEKYISGLSNIINIPYFYNLKVTDTPERLWNRILSKVFNQEVTVSNNDIYDSNNNVIYYEDSDGYWRKQEFDSNNNKIYSKDSRGYWVKREYDSNNNKIYYENSNGDWEKHEYDSNNNLIYYENEDGDWEKQEYDSNNNEIYSENSDGDWWKREYDSNNNRIYYEDSYGKIIDKRNINENIDPEEKYVSGLSNIINIPYFYNLNVTDTPEHLWDRILSKKFNQEVTVSNNDIYDSYDIYDSNNNKIYSEDSDGDWEKREFDSNNNRIYYENSDGSWYKQEFDSNNNRIYYENSRGRIIDKRNINENIDPEEKYVNGLSNLINNPYFYSLRVTDTPKHLWNRILSKKFNQEVRVINNNGIFDSNNNIIYTEYSDGYWWKQEYDSNNNEIYWENSDGDWYKQEYDSNNNRIYLEDSDGNIIDRRSNNPINENIDPEEKYVSGLSNIINIPYFYNLKVTDTPEHLWDRILSKKFNQEVTVYNGLIYVIIYDSNNNQIYYEDSYGYWYKQEFDSNNNRIYYEDSRGRIIDKRNINENIDPEEKYVNGLSSIINPPYFYNLRVTDTPERLWNRILSKKFNHEVTVYNNGIYDSNNNLVYFEDSEGDWEKQEYDSNNNKIYYEDSDGDWSKREYDSNNNEIYVEYSRGYWEKQEYDSNNNRIYYEDSNGDWIKLEYDSNNNIIYSENSDGDITYY